MDTFEESISKIAAIGRNAISQMEETKVHLAQIVTELTAYRALGDVEQLSTIIEFASETVNYLGRLEDGREVLRHIQARTSIRLKEIAAEIHLRHQMGEEWWNQTNFPEG